MQSGSLYRTDGSTVALVGKAAGGILRWIAQAARGFGRKGNQRFTVMFIPHSERKIFNFQLSVFTLLFLGAVLAVLVLAFFSLSTHYTTTNEQIATVSQSLTARETSLETVGDEIIALQQVVEDFRQSLDRVIRVLSSESITSGAGVSGSGDLAAFVSESAVAAADNRGVTELRQLRTYLGGAIFPLTEINDALLAQRELLVNIPTLWPVRGGAGWVTFEFGPQRHPFTNGFYIHKGIDVALRRGSEVVATANGKIQRVDYDPRNLGNLIEVRHKYGFVTRYGHLDRVLVAQGQAVTRGQLIGLMGSTGLSTGPHVHYEVSIAEQLVNPRQFLAISTVSSGR